MPECHKCPHNFAHSRACISCKGAYKSHPKGEPSPNNPNNHGQTHVSIDEVSGFIPAPEPSAAPSDYDAAIHFIRSLCGMRMIEREIIFSRIMGEEFPSITSRLNTLLCKRITVQGVHARAKKALSDPAFSELFRTMLIKQQKRKAKGRTR